jgi:hypothetical protein
LKNEEIVTTDNTENSRRKHEIHEKDKEGICVVGFLISSPLSIDNNSQFNHSLEIKSSFI